MKQSAKRLLSSLLSLVLILGAFAVFFTFIQPTYSEFTQLKAKVQSEIDLLDNQKKTIDNVRKIVTAFDNAANDRIQINLALPTSPMTAEALAQVNVLAVNNHNLSAQGFVATQSLDTGTPEAARRDPKGAPAALVKPYSPIQLQARMAGTYEDFRGFLKNLETNVRLFDVKNISISPAGKANQDIYNFEVRVVTYYQK